MSIIHLNPEDLQAPQRVEPNPRATSVRREPGSHSSHESMHDRDSDMMFAWSIGTTEAASQMSRNRHMEECPPEVYIG